MERFGKDFPDIFNSSGLKLNLDLEIASRFLSQVYIFGACLQDRPLLVTNGVMGPI